MKQSYLSSTARLLYIFRVLSTPIIRSILKLWMQSQVKLCVGVFLMRIFVNCICLAYIVVILCVFVVPYVYLLYYVCIAVLTLDAGLLARSQYPEGPATGHLDTGFSRFPCVYERMLRWFPSFQVATTRLSCSFSDLNFLVTFFSHLCTCKITTANG